MIERPILFKSEMIRAILDGRKTQTRRAVKLPRWLKEAGGNLGAAWADLMFGVTPGLQVPCKDGTVQRLRNPWGWPNEDRTLLWVKETCIISPPNFGDAQFQTHRDEQGRGRCVQYLATAPDTEAAEDWGLKKIPSIFMPRWASRITLQLIHVRAERVMDISKKDAVAEGVSCRPEYAKENYAFLWNDINARRGFSWESNPWVWVLTFRPESINTHPRKDSMNPPARR